MIQSFVLKLWRVHNRLAQGAGWPPPAPYHQQPPPPSGGGQARGPLFYFGIGCGVMLLLALLAAGAAYGIYRLANRATGDESAATDVGNSTGDDGGVGVVANPQVGGGAAQAAIDPVIEMRSRYDVGPGIQVENMIPSPDRVAASMANRVNLQGGPSQNPFRVLGSEYRPGLAPVGVGAQLSRSDRNGAGEQALMVGIPERIAVRGEAPATAYIFYFEGYPGHFYLPATTPTEFGPVPDGSQLAATFGIAIAAARDAQGHMLEPGETMDVPMTITAETESGVSRALTIQLHIQSVGLGDVEIALAMEETTDLDLYVMDPGGDTVSYQNRSSASGGSLDLDANAACGSNMGVNAEHVFYAHGEAPAGRYRVLVSHYSDCTGGSAIHYRITTKVCGETAIFSGTFASGNHSSSGCRSHGDGDNACQQVVEFQAPECRR